MVNEKRMGRPFGLLVLVVLLGVSLLLFGCTDINFEKAAGSQLCDSESGRYVFENQGFDRCIITQNGVQIVKEICYGTDCHASAMSSSDTARWKDGK